MSGPQQEDSISCMSVDAHNAGTPASGPENVGLGAPPTGATFHQPGPGGWPPGAPMAIPAARQGLPRWLAIALIASVALVVGGVIGGLIGANNTSKPNTRAAAPATITKTVTPPTPPQLTPDEAGARVCKALADNYPALVEATKEMNKYESSPWGDPGSISALENEHRVLTALISDLEAALASGPVPADLRNATIEYLTAARARDISDQQHASNKQRGGVNIFYNSVKKKPRELCGL